MNYTERKLTLKVEELEARIEKLENPVKPCVSGSGRLDGHMVYVKFVAGEIVCAFCGKGE